MRLASTPPAAPAFSPRVRLLGIEELELVTGEAASTIYDKIQHAQFPKPIKIGRKNKWRESTIIAHLDRLEKKAGVRP